MIYHVRSHNHCFFFFNDTATTEIYTLSLHDALPIYCDEVAGTVWPAMEITLLGGATGLFTSGRARDVAPAWSQTRSEEHTSELQSRLHLVCRLLLEKKKINKNNHYVV